jgi:hypothetical protein
LKSGITAAFAVAMRHPPRKILGSAASCPPNLAQAGGRVPVRFRFSSLRLQKFDHGLVKFFRALDEHQMSRAREYS